MITRTILVITLIFFKKKNFVRGNLDLKVSMLINPSCNAVSILVFYVEISNQLLKTWYKN